jgi:D-alanyl-D-alanine carboxypeptidase/D-alanyl-D-alanine-endopeptidase (penicillin-binding protein 4)
VWQGQVYLQGSGDPKFTVEQLWLMLRRLQGMGIRHIQGDIIIDRSLFALPPHDPSNFDGEPLRPYNAAPDAWLVNFKSLLIQFSPDPAHKVARVHVEPPLAGVQVQTSVPLMGGDCADYRASLKPEFGHPLQIRFMGGFPASCTEKQWAVAYAEPERFAARALLGMWQHLGGQHSGQVREGTVPGHLKPSFFAESATLGEVVRDINKFSNNVMAEQLFLTLAAQKRGLATPAFAKDVLEIWWRERVGGEPPLLDKGSGLSREQRISAQSLARLLQWNWLQAFMPELIASLPLRGLDGTMKRSKSSASAHLKTGSLRDSMGIAGYVDGPNGQRFVLVAMLNHPNANQGRPVMDALIDWTAGRP